MRCWLLIAAGLLLWLPPIRADVFQDTAQGDMAAVSAYLDRGGDVNAADPDGATALHHATAGNQVTVVKLLLEHKANVNAAKKDGVTPLHVAVALGRAEIAVLLLKAGADKSAPDRLGRTPRDIANEHKQPELAAILESWPEPAALESPDPPAAPEAEPQQPAPEEPPAQASLPEMPTPDVLRRSPAAVHAYFTQLAAVPPETLGMRVRLEVLGHSQAGRPILLVVLTRAGNPEKTPWRLMAVAAQHGDEPGGMWGLLQFVNRLARQPTASDRALLEHVTFYLVPIANPDGRVAFARGTANGRNMNRDWMTAAIPETRAVRAALQRYRPHVLLDLHEDTPRDKAGAYIQSSVGKWAASLARGIRRALADRRLHVPIQIGGRQKSAALLHWSFALRYARPAFLVESKYRGSPFADLDRRGDIHKAAILGVARALIGMK